MKDCKTCIWFGKEKPGQCGNYLCRNQSEYDPRTGVEEADPGGESEGKAVNDYIKRADVFELVMRGNLVSNRNYKSVMRLIMGIPAANVVSASDFRDCRNELCLKCGDYTQKHLGACDGCRWR